LFWQRRALEFTMFSVCVSASPGLWSSISPPAAVGSSVVGRSYFMRSWVAAEPQKKAAASLDASTVELRMRSMPLSSDWVPTKTCA
jgi:hypothetical protein